MLCSTVAVHSTEGEMESAANCLWLVSNSKPCPNCKSPIQKNEGCNHVKCSKVRPKKMYLKNVDLEDLLSSLVGHNSLSFTSSVFWWFYAIFIWPLVILLKTSMLFSILS